MSATTSRKTGQAGQESGGDEQMSGLGARLAFAWTFVGVPLAYGIYETAKKAAALFTG